MSVFFNLHFLQNLIYSFLEIFIKNCTNFGCVKKENYMVYEIHTKIARFFFIWPSSTFNYLSRIDGIFVHPNIQESIIHYHTDDCPLYNTDHSMVVCAISRSDFIILKSNATEKRKYLKRKIFQFNRMTDEIWVNYVLKTDELILKSDLHRSPASLNS